RAVVVELDELPQHRRDGGGAFVAPATLGAIDGAGEERTDTVQVARIDALGVAVDQRGDGGAIVVHGDLLVARQRADQLRGGAPERAGLPPERRGVRIRPVVRL